mgnify:CR=1 FL=1
MNRYSGDTLIKGGKSRSTNKAAVIIRNQIESGQLKFKRVVLGAGVRLDHIAFREYGDASLWWVIAAASGIGWGLQVPPNTYLTIPIEKSKLEALF